MAQEESDRRSKRRNQDGGAERRLLFAKATRTAGKQLIGPSQSFAGHTLGVGVAVTVLSALRGGADIGQAALMARR